MIVIRVAREGRKAVYLITELFPCVSSPISLERVCFPDNIWFFGHLWGVLSSIEGPSIFMHLSEALVLILSPHCCSYFPVSSLEALCLHLSLRAASGPFARSMDSDRHSGIVSAPLSRRIVARKFLPGVLIRCLHSFAAKNTCVNVGRTVEPHSYVVVDLFIVY